MLTLIFYSYISCLDYTHTHKHTHTRALTHLLTHTKLSRKKVDLYPGKSRNVRSSAARPRFS